jgi:hypothetical protein
MEFFSTREWAFLIWIAIAVCYLVWFPKTKDLKKALKDILYAFFVRQIISIFLLMTIYVSVVVYMYSKIGLLEWHQLKNTVIWYIAIASMSLLKIDSIKESPNYLKDSVINNIKLVGIIEFLTSVYTFNILVELIIVPLMVIWGGMLGISQTDKKYKAVEKLLNGVLLVFGSLIIIFTLYYMISDFQKIANEEKIYDFIVPPLLTLAYIPFMMFMVMYTVYENVFVRLKFFVKGSLLCTYAKFITMLRFNVRTSLLERWASSIGIKSPQTISEINLSVNQIFEMVAIEKNPPKIESHEGWSPYEAKDFLISEGVKTRPYHPIDDREWWCGSDLVEISDGLFKNNIAYYVSGDSRVAQTLKLKVNVNWPEDHIDAHDRFISAASALLDRALGIEIPDRIKEAITRGYDEVVKISGAKIEFTKQSWGSHQFGGYDIGLVLSRI